MRCALVAVAAAALALSGCGNGEEREIAGVLTAGLTSQDPGIVCEGSLAPALLTRIYGGVGRCHSIEGETSERISQALSVDVGRVRVEHGRATAVVTIHGGNHDGARGTLVLGRHGGGWRVSDLSVDLLRSEFAVTLGRLHGPDPAMKACIARKMRELDDADFKRMALDPGDAVPRRVSAFARRCGALLEAAGSVRL